MAVVGSTPTLGLTLTTTRWLGPDRDMEMKQIDPNTKWHRALWGLAYCVFDNLDNERENPRWVRTRDVWERTPKMWKDRQQVYNFVNHRRLRENGLVERNWNDAGGGFVYHLTPLGVETLADMGAPDDIPLEYQPALLVDYLEGQDP